jgi:hypothetical protein
MPRPQKQKADYFPHFVHRSRTLKILQSRFGNDGYSFWFKLLTLLCDTEGQAFNFRSGEDWQYLLAETNVPEDTARNILALLAEIEAIDLELYNDKTIWIQHLVDNLSPLYKRRQLGTPVRPKPQVNGVDVSNNVMPTGLSPAIIRKEEKSIGKKRKERRVEEKQAIQFDLPEWIDQKTWEAFIEMRRQKGKPPTVRAIELIAQTLTTFKELGDDPNEVLNQSIVNTWMDVYRLKKTGGYGNGHKSTGVDTRPAETRELTQADIERKWGVRAPLT